MIDLLFHQMKTHIHRLSIMAMVVPVLIMMGCSEHCVSLTGLDQNIYAPVEPLYATGFAGHDEPSALEPESKLSPSSDALVYFYRLYGDPVRGPDKLFGVLTNKDRLKLTKVCHVSNSAVDGLFIYAKILTGPLRDQVVRLYGCVTVGNTGVLVEDFSSEMTKLEERRKAGEHLDFKTFHVLKKYLVLRPLPDATP